MRLRSVLVLATVVAILPAGMAMASSHTVDITAPTDGATVGGVVDVTAATTGTVTSVTFEWAASEAGPWTLFGGDTDGADGWTASWSTAGYEGPAVIRATASDGSSDVTDTVSVTVDEPPVVTVKVSPDAFSPNGDGRKDVATIEASSNEGGDLEIQVVAPGGEVKRSWHRTASPGETVAIEWNGRAGGKVLPDATYKIRAKADGAQDQAQVVLDTKAPTFKWRAIAPEPLNDQDLVRFRFTSYDRAHRLQVKLVVRDRVRVVGTEEDEVAPGKRSVAWKPKYPGGGKLFPGLFTGRITAKDDAGNVRKSSERPWRVSRRVADHVYTRVQGAGPRVALTFDDCHYADAWRRILDILEARDLEATFFCPGRMMQANAGLVKRAAKEGHTIGSHAWDHALLTGHSVSFTAGRLERDAKVAWQVARTTTWPYFRPPYGSYDKNVLAAAEATAHPRVILWDVDPRDWQTPGVSTIVSRVVSQSHSGSIVVLHTLNQTASALPGILDGLAAKGLKPVDLPDLFQAAGFR